MSLLKKAEKIFNKLNDTKNIKSVLISEKELESAIIKNKENRLSSNKDKKELSENKKIYKSTNIEIKENVDELNSVKIQKSEIERLYKKNDKKDENTKFSEINILDKLISNTKIFLKNLSYINNTSELFEYLDMNLSSYYYINSYVIFFQNKFIHSFNIEKHDLNLILNHISNFPDQFESTFALMKAESFFNDIKLNKNYYIYPLFITNNNYGYIILEIKDHFYKNEYYLDFIAMLLNLIPSFVPSIISTLDVEENNIIKILPILLSQNSIYIYNYLNPPFLKIKEEKLIEYLNELDKLIKNEKMITFNYKKFFSNKINKDFIIKLKSLNLIFNIKDEPLIKTTFITGKSGEIRKKILSII